MTKSSIFDSIENGEVFTDLMFASTAGSLISRMSRNATLAEAVEYFKSDPEFRQAAFEHASSIFGDPAELGYAHPKRSALAAYLYLFFMVPVPECRLLTVQIANASRPDLMLSSEVGRIFSGMLTDTTMSEDQPIVTVFPASIAFTCSKAKTPEVTTSEITDAYPCTYRLAV